MAKKFKPKFTFGPIETCDNSPIIQIEQPVSLGDRHIGYIGFLRPEYQKGYYSHYMAFSRKEFDQGIKMEKANSFDEIAKILVFHYKKIRKIAKNLG